MVSYNILNRIYRNKQLNYKLGVVRSCNYWSWCCGRLPSSGASAFDRTFSRTSEEGLTRRSYWSGSKLDAGVANVRCTALSLRGMETVGTSDWVEAIIAIIAILFREIFEMSASLIMLSELGKAIF